jgi:hypothetical protein
MFQAGRLPGRGVDILAVRVVFDISDRRHPSQPTPS